MAPGLKPDATGLSHSGHSASDFPSLYIIYRVALTIPVKDNLKALHFFGGGGGGGGGGGIDPLLLDRK